MCDRCELPAKFTPVVLYRVADAPVLIKFPIEKNLCVNHADLRTAGDILTEGNQKVFEEIFAEKGFKNYNKKNLFVVYSELR